MSLSVPHDPAWGDSSPRLAVLTGGPGCGKTTLLNALAESGVAIIPEAAMLLIRELNTRFGIEGQRSWRQAHFGEFQELLVERQSALELAVDHQVWTVADRGLFDIVGFCRFKGVEAPARIHLPLAPKRYRVAFLLDPLPVFEERRDTGRLYDREEALAIGEHLRQAYMGAGIPIVPVPVADVKERLMLVKNTLQSLSTKPGDPEATANRLVVEANHGT